MHHAVLFLRNFFSLGKISGNKDKKCILYYLLKSLKFLIAEFFFEKPFIGFEPTTYVLPWRYSTTELKGPIIENFDKIHCIGCYESTALTMRILYII